ncbi:hypothetical protein G1H11_17505 [Phytoactinopolyspora alkaliphila]|uniref:Uncharacterized protein n=1 Tax=Phytoactinopolyspora alkaliphila TaxID=1783498 RepID=A0A6N9YQK0_9ACTN|nr:hypothetical protein [Phytoactinopolyspora alkaliphila]NED97099.1 hypothetical protein [Phytoactinopolyspora alkaliphila]
MTASAEPLDEQQVDFLLFLVDEVDDLTCVVGAERPPPYCAVRVCLVLGSAVPWCELENVEDIGVGS